MDHLPPKEAAAAQYERHNASRNRYDDFLYGDEERKELLVRLIGTGNRVLDIGCRSGNLTRHYAAGNHVVGVDVDRTALAMFRERLGFEAHWVDLDHEPLPFAAQSFDVVVFTEVMEHLQFPDRALLEIRRVLRENGRLVGSVPNAFRLRNRWRFLWGKSPETDPTHLHSYSPLGLRGLLAEHFRDIELLPVSGHLLGGGRYGIPVPRWLPARMRLLLCLDLIFVCHEPIGAS